MRVLLIGDFPPPAGGIAVHVEQSLLFLREHGVTAKVLNTGKGGRSDPDVFAVRSWAHYAKALARFAADGWLLHLHTSGNNARSWWVAASVGACGSLGAPRVVTIHSGRAPGYLEASLAGRLSAAAALPLFSTVIAVSEPVATSLRNLRVRDEIRVQPAFFKAQQRPGEPPEELKAILGRRSPLLAVAHAPMPIYGRALIFEALRALAPRYPRLGLAIFGPGTRSSELLADARRFGVESMLEDLGDLSHGAALAVMQRSSVFVRPTFADGDAMSVREALALGTRCVASDVSPRPEGCRTFKTGEARDLARAIHEALGAPAVRVPPVDAGPMLMRVYRELTASARPVMPRVMSRGSHDATH